ncbi:MAG TPA: hypothetical protein VGZ91_01660 [Candidatus Sulfotelmatobacter sp.]|nr:hypothetical protein [Candidatus Sulfotelmatobacter sp.]
MDSRLEFLVLIAVAALPMVPAGPAALAQSTSSSSQHVRKAAPAGDSRLDAGSVSNGLYRNQAFGFTCKIPAGWVLRTEEMNDQQNEQPTPDSAKVARVLLAAFLRPPAARGEDVNSSILIAAESASSYPGLKEAAQYFGPVTEIAKAQGFDVVSEPYDFEIGAKPIVRADFQKDIGTRVMRQSTLVILARGYAVSYTFIGGTEDEVEELIAGLSFGVSAKAPQR